MAIENKYSRIVLKLTGESFGGEKRTLIDHTAVSHIAHGIKTLLEDTGVQLAIVNGGGNLYRGRDHKDSSMVDPAQLDYIGMLSTIMNALALQHELRALSVETRVMSSLRTDQACEPYIRLRAIHFLEKGYPVIFAGGTGSPFFTTDSAAAFKAGEINAKAVLKATNVDGIFDSDPKQNPDAKQFSTITFSQALSQNLTVMDGTAFAYCQARKIPIIVFNANDFGNVARIVRGEKIGTLVTPD